jgi:L-ascorbate metabolism protein UlaG (beta-lactamase superfamily)
LARQRPRPPLSFVFEIIGKSAFRIARGAQHKPVIAESGELAITFIGHASFLLQMGGLNILIDPVFAHWLILVHRRRRPGVRLKDLPPIDIVLITHAHMDHLNFPSLRRIIRHSKKRSGKAPMVIVPHNVDDLVSKIGFSAVRSLEWWQSTNVAGIEITMTPAKHWGARVFTDSHRIFGGYVLRHYSHAVYHAGDTGYSPEFAEIRQRLYPKIALLPIGAYKPESFRGMHMNPEDAVQAFLDLDAEHLVPMHYGTFQLSEEPMEEPLERLEKAAEQAGVSRSLDVIGEGETRIFPPEKPGVRDI